MQWNVLCNTYGTSPRRHSYMYNINNSLMRTRIEVTICIYDISISPSTVIVHSKDAM